MSTSWPENMGTNGHAAQETAAASAKKNTQGDIIYQQYEPQYQPSARQNGPKGFAITSMVLGIVSLVIPYGGIITGILAIVFGAVSRNKNEGGRGMAIAGLVCGIVALALWVIVIIAVAASSA